MKPKDLTNNKSVRIGGSLVGIIALIWLGRVWYHSPPTDAQTPDPEPPAQTEITPEPEPQIQDEPAAAEPHSEERQAAIETWEALRRHLNAYAWELSKLPKDELNNICWENRPRIQALKDEFDGGEAIAPSDFRGHESVLLDDLTCRMARHFQITGDAPEWASTDISELEGLPDAKAND